jgi:hypothetical protein
LFAVDRISSIHPAIYSSELFVHIRAHPLVTANFVGTFVGIQWVQSPRYQHAKRHPHSHGKSV